MADEQKITVRIKQTFRTENVIDKFNGHGVLVGNATKTHADGPFDVDAKKAQELIKLGVAEAVVRVPGKATEKAIENRQDAQRR